MPDLPLQGTAFVFAALFLVILAAPLVAERARAPGLIGLLLAGAVLGPSGLGVLERVGVVEMLGGAGLLYLMFVSGLDLDLDGFREHRRDAIVFGSLTFLLPTAGLVAGARAFDLSWPAAAMIGSAFASHTMLTLPLVRRFGIGRNRAITTAVGGTLLSTIAALVLLAIAAAAGGGGGGLAFWLVFPLEVAVFGVLAVIGLPRLTRWVFRGVGQDRAVRLTYILTAMFALAAIADMLSIEPIVGAFVAGLAVNRFVGEGTLVRERLEVLGSALFIPTFLVSTGMLIDPIAAASSNRTLAMGAAFTVITVATKWLAAAPLGRVLGFDRAERGMLVSLTTGQAAGALAAVIVARDLDLVGQEVLDAAVLVIAATALFSAVVGQRAAPVVPVPPWKVRGIGQTVIVPVANPDTAEPLVAIAGLIAARDHGSVVAVNVLDHDADPAELNQHRAVTAQAESAALRVGAEATALVRIDANPTAGVLHTVVEHGGTSILLGWKGFTNRRQAFFGSIIDAIIARANVPVLVVHPGEDDEIRRVILSLTERDLVPGGARTLTLAVDVAVRLAQQAERPLVVLSQAADETVRRAMELPEGVIVEVEHDTRSQPVALRTRTEPGDIVVVGAPPTPGRLGQRTLRVGRAVADRTLVIVVPH